MRLRLLPHIHRCAHAALLGLALINAPIARADTHDPIGNLIPLISYEVQEPHLDIAQASVTDCILTLETLRKRPDGALVSTTTTVPLEILKDSNSWFRLREGAGAQSAWWSVAVPGGAAKATYRVDRPTRQVRQWFKDRFDERCSGDLCETEYQPRQIDIYLRSSTPPGRATFVQTFQAAAAFCAGQTND